MENLCKNIGEPAAIRQVVVIPHIKDDIDAVHLRLA